MPIQEMVPPQNRKNSLTGWMIWALCGVLVFTGTGCGLLHLKNSDPKAQVGSFTQKRASDLVPLRVLQSQVMRFADEYAATVAQAVDDFSAKVGTPEAHLAALRWKLGQATSAYIDATGVNPALNALDTLVLVTMARMVMEDYGLETYGPAIQPLIEVHRRLEGEAWELANGVLKPAQQQEVRELIKEWRAKNPHQRYVGFIRFREFVIALGKMPQAAKTSSTSVFSLLFIDPLASLDPTAAAIEETRRLGERAMFYTQRMPTLLSWQTEVLANQLANQPQARELIANSTRLAAAAENFTATAAQIPSVLDQQREQLVAVIQQEEPKARALLAEARQTFSAGNDMAASVNAAVQSLDQFVRFVTPTNKPAESSAANSNSFNILDYGRTAGQVGVAAGELNTLLNSLNETAPQVARLRQQTTADAEHLLHRAFFLGLILIVVLLVGAVLAALFYRVLVGKLTRHRFPGPRPEPELSRLDHS